MQNICDQCSGFMFREDLSIPIVYRHVKRTVSRDFLSGVFQLTASPSPIRGAQGRFRIWSNFLLVIRIHNYPPNACESPWVASNGEPRLLKIGKTPRCLRRLFSSVFLGSTGTVPVPYDIRLSTLPVPVPRERQFFINRSHNLLASSQRWVSPLAQITKYLHWEIEGGGS